MPNAVDRARKMGLRYSACMLFARVVPPYLLCCEVQHVVCACRRLDREGAVPVEFARAEGAAELAAVQGFTPVAPGMQGESSFAILARKGGELVASVWGAREFYVDRELGIRLVLPEGGSWLHSAKVERAYRRGGIFSGLIDQVVEHTRGGTVYAMYHAFNKASAAAFARHGKERVGKVFVLTVLGVTLCITRGGLRRDRSWAWRAPRRPIEIRWD